LKLKNIFNVPVWGLGSIVTHGEMTGKGYATSLIKKCIESIEEKEDVFIFLYSDIRPDFYQRLGFKLLPDKLQKNKKSICMVRCGESNWEKLIKSLPEEIPDYF
jgi:N-acetylglutamate synthase-like GNAT family acetyltransferase